MSVGQTGAFHMDAKEWKKSLRDLLVEWGIAMIPVLVNFGCNMVDATGEFLDAEQLVVAVAIFKVAAPFIKRWLNIFRVK